MFIIFGYFVIQMLIKKKTNLVYSDIQNLNPDLRSDDYDPTNPTQSGFFDSNWYDSITDWWSD